MTTRARWTRSPSPPDEARKLALQVMLCARLDELLAELGARAHRSPKAFTGPCPVHGGRKPDGFVVYREGDSVPGYWQCWTRGCHGVFTPTVLGLVRGLLSRERHGWDYLADPSQRSSQRTASFKETLDWCCSFLGVRFEDIKVDHEELERRRFASAVGRLTAGPAAQKKGIPRSEVRKFLRIPSDYFVDRGFSREVLDRFDVGLYPAKGKPLSDRVAVPVYDETGKYAVGFTGRSVHPACPSCSRYHAQGAWCPSKDDPEAYGRTAKWFNHSLNKDQFLYNWHSARNAIADCGVAVIVEGPGDVWRLEEAGVTNGLALFGVTLSERQQVLLEMSGAMNLVILTDADRAGDGAREQLKKRLSRSFRLAFPELPNGSKDVGEMPVEAVKDCVLSLSQKLSRRW